MQKISRIQNRGGLIPIDKKEKIVVFGWVLGIFLLGAVHGYLFCQLSNNGAGTGQIGADIQSVRDQQQSAIDRLGGLENGLNAGAGTAGAVSAVLGNIAGGITDIAGGIAETESRIDASQDRIRDSQRLINEGQRILQEVKGRAETP